MLLFPNGNEYTLNFSTNCANRNHTGWQDIMINIIRVNAYRCRINIMFRDIYKSILYEIVDEHLQIIRYFNEKSVFYFLTENC